MSATATMQRTQEKTSSWSAVFPNEQVTRQQSALFVKKLLAVAVSNIAYLRAIFPENAFGDRSLEDLHLKVLRDDSSCPGACQVIRWIKGCFDALDKQYLKSIIIGIYQDPENTESVIESYTFKFTYGAKGGMDVFRNKKHVSSAHSASETKKATMRLLRTIVVLTQTLHSLPDDVMMTMKLLYYDDVTPADYEPPGFTSSDTDTFNFEDEPLNIHVGDVTTPFHTVKMRVRTSAQQFEMVDEEEMEEPVPETINSTHPEAHPDMVTEDAPDHPEGVPKPTEADEPPKMTPMKPDAGSQKTQDQGSEAVTVVVNGQEESVHCPCGGNEDDGLMILCAVCKHWQHAVCFCIIKEEQAPGRHICNLCANPKVEDLAPTDPSLQGLSEVAVQAQCLWRRALHACTETNRLQQTTLSRRLGVEMTVASGLVNRLEKEGYLKAATKGKRLGKLVDKDKLMNEAFPKYLELETPKELSELSQDPPKDDVIDEESVTKEIESLASRTEEIKLDGRRGKRNNDGKLVQEKKEGKTEKARRGRKRAKARNDESEFEVSNSQDPSQEFDNGIAPAPKRKRKASIAAKAVLV